MEADLSRYHQIDLRDLYRRDEGGARRLTLRMVYVRVSHLPPESATARALDMPGWTVGDYLLADVYGALAGQHHPSKPKPVEATRGPDSESKRRAARRRATARQQAIESGEIT